MGIMIIPKSANKAKIVLISATLLVVLVLGYFAYQKYLQRPTPSLPNPPSQQSSKPQINLADPALKKSSFSGKVTDIGKDYVFVNDKRYSLTSQTSCFYGTQDKKSKVGCDQMQKGDTATAEESLQPTGPNEYKVLGITAIYFTH